jgi:hypothetical protein
VAHKGGVVAQWSAPDCCPVVKYSNLEFPQPTVDCQSPSGLPPGMELGCGLTSVRGDRGENRKNELLVRQKTYKKEACWSVMYLCWSGMSRCWPIAVVCLFWTVMFVSRVSMLVSHISM